MPSDDLNHLPGLSRPSEDETLDDVIERAAAMVAMRPKECVFATSMPGPGTRPGGSFTLLFRGDKLGDPAFQPRALSLASRECLSSNTIAPEPALPSLITDVRVCGVPQLRKNGRAIPFLVASPVEVDWGSFSHACGGLTMTVQNIANVPAHFFATLIGETIRVDYDSDIGRRMRAAARKRR